MAEDISPNDASLPSNEGTAALTTPCQNIPGTTSCSQHGPISALTVKIENIGKKTDDLDDSYKKIASDFSELKIHSIEHNGKLESILEKFQYTLEMSVKEHEKFNKAVEQNTNDIASMKTDITALKGDVHHIKGDLKEHTRRIGGLERISYWVYAGVAVLIIIGFIVANWSTGKDIIGNDSRPDTTIKEGYKPPK